MDLSDLQAEDWEHTGAETGNSCRRPLRSPRKTWAVCPLDRKGRWVSGEQALDLRYSLKAELLVIAHKLCLEDGIASAVSKMGEQSEQELRCGDWWRNRMRAGKTSGFRFKLFRFLI